MQNEDKPKKFRKLSDIYNVAAANVAAYIPYLSMAYFTHPESLPNLLTIIPCVFMALRIPYVREVPVALSRILMNTMMIRGKESADDKIKDMVEKLAEKADMKPPKVISYSKGATDNAAAATNQIYVGKSLSEKLNDKELEFVLAHELSHIKTKDISEMYLSWPPFVNSLIGMAGMAVAAVQTPSITTAAFTLASFAYFKYQGLLSKHVARTIEHRADRNALQLTGDLHAAVNAQVKLEGIDKILAPPPLKETLNATHPIGQKRIIGLCQAFNEQSGVDKNSPLDIDIPDDLLMTSTWAIQYQKELNGDVRGTFLEGIKFKEDLTENDRVEQRHPKIHYENGAIEVITTEKLVKEPSYKLSK